MSNIQAKITASNCFTALTDGILPFVQGRMVNTPARYPGMPDVRSFQIDDNFRRLYTKINFTKGLRPEYNWLHTEDGDIPVIFAASLGEINMQDGKKFPVLNARLGNEKGFLLRVDTYPDEGQDTNQNLGYVISTGNPQVLWTTEHKQANNRHMAMEALLWMLPGDAVDIAFSGRRAYQVKNLDGKIVKEAAEFDKVHCLVEFNLGVKLANRKVENDKTINIILAGLHIMRTSIEAGKLNGAYHGKFAELAIAAHKQQVDLGVIYEWIESQRKGFTQEDRQRLINLGVITPENPMAVLGMKPRTASDARRQLQIARGFVPVEQPSAPKQAPKVFNIADMMF